MVVAGWGLLRAFVERGFGAVSLSLEGPAELLVAGWGVGGSMEWFPGS